MRGLHLDVFKVIHQVNQRFRAGHEEPRLFGIKLIKPAILRLQRKAQVSYLTSI